MTDKELIYIKTIADEKNITQAAAKLFMTQPALSYALKALEAEIGAKLFERTQKGMKLTYVGENYYAMAVNILNIYNDFKQKLVDISEMQSGCVRIGMTRNICTMLLPVIIKEFSSKYPNIKIEVKESSSAILEELVGLRQLDFAVIHCDSKMTRNNESAAVMFRSLKKDNICVLAQKEMKYKELAVKQEGYRYPVLDIKQLKKTPIVLESRHHCLRRSMDAVFENAGVCPDIIMEIESFETAKRLAEIGYAVTFANEQYIDELMNVQNCDVYSIPENYHPYWFVCLVLPDSGYISIAAKKMIQLIENNEQ